MEFNKKLIEEMDFEWVELAPSKYSKEGQYGKAESRKPKGKVILHWNHNYYGEGDHHLTVMEDGGSRTVFHGKISNIEHLKLVLSIVIN